MSVGLRNCPTNLHFPPLLLPRDGDTRGEPVGGNLSRLVMAVMSHATLRVPFQPAAFEPTGTPGAHASPNHGDPRHRSHAAVGPGAPHNDPPIIHSHTYDAGLAWLRRATTATPVADVYLKVCIVAHELKDAQPERNDETTCFHAGCAILLAARVAAGRKGVMKDQQT